MKRIFLCAVMAIAALVGLSSCERDGASDAQEFVDYYMGSITTYAATEHPIEQASVVVATDAKSPCREFGKRVASKSSGVTLLR